MSLLSSNRYNNNMEEILYNGDNNIICEDYNSQRESINNIKRKNNIEINDNIKRLNHSQTFDNILKKETNWSKDIKEYEYSKKQLQWGRNPKINRITKQDIALSDRNFNPITQRYTDRNYENLLKKQEKADITNHIINAYDNQLSQSSVFNIINLEDKLKGLEKSQAYPKVTLIKRKKLFPLSPKINYNLISNLSYKLHYFDKPEKRPVEPDNNNDNVIDFYNNGGKQRKKIIITKNLKDFNVITNEYLNNNDEKNKINLELQRLSAAKKIFKYRKKDPITGIYYDEDKEKDYLKQKELNEKKLLNKKKEGLFNPFNFAIYDEEGLKLKDKKEENKKLRYKIRNKIENYYYNKNIIQVDKYTNILNNKLLYDRFKEIEKRGYDIINNKEILKINKNENIRNKKTPWEIIMENSNNNENISKMKLSIPKNKDDIEKKYIEIKSKRNEEIKKLPRINSDPFFRLKKNKSKINYEDINSNRVLNENSFSMDKKDWFNKNININY